MDKNLFGRRKKFWARYSTDTIKPEKSSPQTVPVAGLKVVLFLSQQPPAPARAVLEQQPPRQRVLQLVAEVVRGRGHGG
jgi:hypothetical protein